MATRRAATVGAPMAPKPQKADTIKARTKTRAGKTKSRAKNAPRDQCPKPTGRPVVQVDLEQLDHLAKIGCTYAEMAAVLKISVDTLSSRFSARIEQGREAGKSSLRRAQWKAALGGNPTMMIWLGKQELGQRDLRSVETTGPNGGPIQTQDLTSDERERRLLAILERVEAR